MRYALEKCGPEENPHDSPIWMIDLLVCINICRALFRRSSR